MRFEITIKLDYYSYQRNYELIKEVFSDIPIMVIGDELNLTYGIEHEKVRLDKFAHLIPEAYKIQLDGIWFTREIPLIKQSYWRRLFNAILGY